MKRQITYSEHPNRATRRAHAMGDKQFRSYDTSAINPRRRAILPTIFAVLLLGAVVGGIGYFFTHNPGLFTFEEGSIKHGVDVSFVVEEGEPVADIGRTLKKAQLIGNVDTFTNAVKDKGVEADLKPGVYTILGGTSVDDIIAILQQGPEANTFTIPEGLTLARTAQLVEEGYAGQITADDFIKVATNASAFETEFPFVTGAYGNSLEGFLFPKTYAKAESDTAETVVRKMLAQYKLEVEALDYSYAQNHGLSSYDVVKLASIIEREAAADNRATVSSVFYNRLAQDMPLQSDATVAYLIDGDPTPEDLEIESPYNTYKFTGLPAGPICSPGLEALKAACAPEETDYLYFYFTPGKDGVMNYSFSTTYDEHQDAIQEG